MMGANMCIVEYTYQKRVCEWRLRADRLYLYEFLQKTANMHHRVHKV